MNSPRGHTPHNSDHKRKQHINSNNTHIDSKRRRTSTDNQKHSMSKVATPIPIHKSRFNTQSGVRKLVIKNLRLSPSPSLDDYYDDIFRGVTQALANVLHDKSNGDAKNRFYRDVQELCRHGQAEALYKHIKDACRNYLSDGPLKQIKAALNQDEDKVTALVLNCWNDWTHKTSIIRSVFSYLDQSFLLKSRTHDQINDTAISLFRNIIFHKNPAIATHVYQGLCELIRKDRENEPGFDADLLRNSITMLHLVDLYKVGLEPMLIEQSKSWFTEFRRTRITSSLSTYIPACVKLLEREATRADSFKFDSSTKRNITIHGHAILVKDVEDVLTDNEAVGELLDNNSLVCLRQLYDLLAFSKLQGDLKKPWDDYIKKTGSVIVSDKEKSDEMVVRLLELKRRLDNIIRDGFGKDDTFKFAMRESFGNFMNDRKNTAALGSAARVGEVIAKYINLLLMGGLKAVPRSLLSDSIDREDAEKAGQASTGDEDAELDRQLEQGLELFRFIEGKDVFEAFYKKDLARRLLMGRSASQDAERSMLTKLKSECGSSFTQNLEQMFKDTELSRDEMISYSQSLSNTSKTTLNLSVSILQQAAWPTYLDVPVNLPEDVANHLSKFDRHYKYKHTGRKLHWKHNLAHSVVKATFNKGIKELVVSGFQAIVLVLFNDLPADGALSFPALLTATGLPEAELKRTLQSLACTKTRILTKHPKGRDVDDTDTFTVNLTFTDPKFRIKINQIQLKETKEENKETLDRVDQDRQYETQAAIVRIMKARKKMTHSGLVAECIEQTRGRGSVEVAEIKKNIEKLIEKEYLDRLEGGSYEYLA